MAVELLGGYLAHAHVGAHKPVPGDADATGTVKWSWPGCPMREGLYNFAEMIKCFRQAGYQGFISVEDFRGDCSPEDRLRDAIAYLKKL
jgi:sugar phosphate isomerase/epimerase